MIRNITLAAAGALCLAAPAVAKDIELAQRAAAPVRGASAASSTDAPDRKYCFAPEAVTGSRLHREKCLTKAQWLAQGIEISAR